MVLFFASAADLDGWASIPRKTDRFRSLYQRFLEDKNAKFEELKNLWNRPEDDWILVPTAVLLAIPDGIKEVDGEIDLSYTDEGTTLPVDDMASHYARLVLPRFRQRGEPEEGSFLASEISLLERMIDDAVSVREEYGLADDADEARFKQDFVEPLRRLAHPALVIDGQHRLESAWESPSSAEIILPVIGLPNASWDEQIFQFIAINAKSNPIKKDHLRDILGNSLSADSSPTVRAKLRDINFELDDLVLAPRLDREPISPFQGLMQIKLEGEPDDNNRHITAQTLENLALGQQGARSFMTDSNLRSKLVHDCLGLDDVEWCADDLSGKWFEYFCAFWRAVRDYYTSRGVIWGLDHEDTLTRSLKMKTLQTVFVQQCPSILEEGEREIEKDREKFFARWARKNEISVGEAEESDEALEGWEEERSFQQAEGMYAWPAGGIDDFESWVKQEFLSRIHSRFFNGPWKQDDTSGGRDEALDYLTRVYVARSERMHRTGLIN